MRISGRRIYKINRYLGDLNQGAQFRFLTEVTAQKRERVGLSEDLEIGSTFLPPILGPVTRYNAEGRWLIRRDLPKESRYITTRYWRWKTWDGEEHEEPRDVFRDCFPRELINPPSVELSMVEHNLTRYFVSPIYARQDGEQVEALHAANLFLELFGYCNVISGDIAQYTPNDVTHVNWKLLPPGEHPWESLKSHIERGLRNASDEGKVIIQDRAETIRSYEPSRMLVGSGGFSDYIAYVFEEMVILESIRRDNALYVFGEDWEYLSTLSKAEIIHSNLQKERIIHTNGWKTRLAELFV